jgi:hypothetical protein
MSAEFKIDGIAEMRKALQDLPAQLRERELGPIVESTAKLFAADLPSRYPAKTGALRSGLRVAKRGDLVQQVRTTAAHAHLYEYGSISRYTNRLGAYRGRMPKPAQPAFIPWAIRWRERMVEAVKNKLRTLRVPGFEGTLGVNE